VAEVESHDDGVVVLLIGAWALRRQRQDGECHAVYRYGACVEGLDGHVIGFEHLPYGIIRVIARTVVRNPEETPDGEGGDNLVHAAKVIAVAMRHDGERHLVHAPFARHCVGLLAVGSSINHDPALVWRADEDAVSLAAVYHLDSHRLELGREGW
jgi:hypothetical protein